MVVIGEATIDEWRAQAKKYLGNLPPEPGGELFFFKVVAELRDRDGRSAPVVAREKALRKASIMLEPTHGQKNFGSSSGRNQNKLEKSMQQAWDDRLQ
jgi:hypothetical protein